MKSGIIVATGRHVLRSMRGAIQGNVIRALVELITNADDSYIRMEGREENCTGTIYVTYRKQGTSCCLAVRDLAEGMTYDKILKSFSEYGGDTSGSKRWAVRGYFGQGAKDVLATMIDGKMYTFRDGWMTECRLFTKGEKPRYEIEDPIEATSELRRYHRIYGNGTVAYFTADRERTGTIPQFATVQEQITNNHLLRKILTNPRRKVWLVNESSSKPDRRPLRYRMPKGEKVHEDSFSISYGEFGEFPVHIAVWQATEGELTQSGDDRIGGLLLVDDKNVVLGISLFKYDHEPLAARLFGELKITGFRKLLDKQEAVLSDKRDGLERRHPFCRKLIPEIEKRLSDVIQKEKARKRKEVMAEFDAEEAARYRKAFRILNQIAEDEVKDAINLVPQTEKGEPEPPPDGLSIYPPQARISVGKRYNFEVRWDPRKLQSGSLVKVTSSHPKISILSRPFRIEPTDCSRVMRRYVTVEGKEANVKGTIRASCRSKESEATVYVVPEQDLKDLLLEEGMVFQPESLTLRPNQPRRLQLLVYVKRIEGGSKVKLSSDNSAVHLSVEEIIVDDTEAKRHVATHQLEVWGEGAGQDALITAEYEQSLAVCQVRVRAKPVKKSGDRKTMFNEPEFDMTTPDPLQRTSYSSETGKLIIYVNFPSVKHYLGPQCEHRKSLPAQVMVADLVAETCFREIATKRVKASGVLPGPAALAGRIQRETYQLSKKYGKKVHMALVDTKLLEESRKVTGDQT